MSLDGGVVLVDPVSGKPYSLGVGTESIGGVGLIGGVTLVDPETGMAYKADAGGGGAVESVNGKTGAVVLDASDVGATPLTEWYTDGPIRATSLTLIVDQGSLHGDPEIPRQFINVVVTHGLESYGEQDIFVNSIPLRMTDSPDDKLGTFEVGPPSQSNHPATKGYVDDQVQSIEPAVNSVNSKQGDVVLTAEDVGATTQNYVDTTLNGRIPKPPATGNYRLESVDGVAEWVEV